MPSTAQSLDSTNYGSDEQLSQINAAVKKLKLGDYLLVALNAELQRATPQIREAIDDKALKLEEQIRKFVVSRWKELVSFACHELAQHEQEARAQARIRQDAETALRRPPLKSIMKRRPSLKVKRVSFSTLSPEIEEFSRDSIVDPTAATPINDDMGPESTACLLDNLKLQNGVTESRNNPNSTETSDDEVSQTPQVTGNGETLFNSCRGSRTGNGAASVSQLVLDVPTQKTSEPRFVTPVLSFDDLLEYPSSDTSAGAGDDAPDETGAKKGFAVNKHRYKDNKHNSLLSMLSPVIGSAPIDIAFPDSYYGLDRDGGPKPSSVMEKKDEADLDLSYISEEAKKMDPSRMSFSQRMVWEERHHCY